VRATITDADGTVWGGAAYIYAATAAFAAISGSATTPVACTFVPALGYHACPTTSTAVGTSHLKVIDAATVALSNVASAETPVKVTAGTASTVKIAFDKATYAPGEKAVVSVTVLDAAGGILPATGTSTTTIANVFTSTGIVSSVALTGAALTSTDVVIAPSSSSTSGTTAGSQNYVVYMPMASGDVTLTATGSTGLATAGRVAVSATASVVNSSVDAATDAANEATDAANAATDAALAAADAADAATAAAQDASDAVAALSASVSKLISSLRAQITSLTNLVIKIQKKVRA
jgi:trimeric autotransporter adhesin